VVDSDPSVRESLELLVCAAGWRAETFASGQEFLARPRSFVPSCLILDVTLPDLTRELHNGVDVTRQGATLQVVDDGYHVSRVVVTPRIGITKAADLPLRFLITSDHRAARVKAEAQRTRPI
jgi:FixJ family two-component response regulator